MFYELDSIVRLSEFFLCIVFFKNGVFYLLKWLVGGSPCRLQVVQSKRSTNEQKKKGVGKNFLFPIL